MNKGSASGGGGSAFRGSTVIKHRGWGQEAHTARSEAECCMVPRDPTLSALLLIQHILSML